MICPDKQLDMWEYCDNSVILANADWYYTKQQTEELIDSVSGMNPTEVQDMINRSIHSKADKTYVDEKDTELSDSIRAINSNLTRVYTKTDVNNLLDRKQNVLIAGSGITISGDVISSTGGGGDVTSGQVQSMIDHSISGKVDTSTFNTYSASTNVAINNKQDTLIAGDNITIVNNVISSTASGDVTSAQVETMIATSISGKADTTAVTQDIATATNDMATKTWVQNQGYLTEHQSLSAYSTTDEMNQAISAATDDMATETWVGNQGYITGVDLSNYATLQDIPTSNSALTNDAGYITSAALNGYATEDYVTAATDDMATETWVNQQGFLTEHQSLSAYSTTVEMNEAISASTSGKVDTSTYTAYTAATDTALQGKQDTLISGTNIKTINNVSILGSGNVDIQGSGNPTVEVTQAEYDALVSAGTVSADTFYIITDATAGDLSNYYTKSETSGATQISTALSGKQDTLVAGDNITISGNVISAEGGGASYQAGTNIDITNDTISCTLPISGNSDGGTITVGYDNSYLSSNIIFGRYNTLSKSGSLSSIAHCSILGRDNTISVTSFKNISSNSIYGDSNIINPGTGTANNIYGRGFNLSGNGESTYVGQYGTSVGENRAFVIGDGYLDGGNLHKHYHNALKITNGDVYVVDTNDTSTNDYFQKPMIKLQDYMQYKMAKVTQAEYDALVQAGTVDQNTVYMIVNNV